MIERSVVDFRMGSGPTGRWNSTSGRNPSGALSRRYCVHETEPQSWFRRGARRRGGTDSVPGPTLWNSPALMVTGAMVSGVDEDEVGSMFDHVTGKPLRPRTAR